MSESEIATPAKRYLSWIEDDALPLWASVGINPGTRGSVERLLEDGQADRASKVRVLVQARQIFVFCAAQQFGWYSDSERHVNGIVNFVNEFARHDSGAGYVHTLTAEGAASDQRLDLYTHAFLLLAEAWRYRVFGVDSAQANAREIMSMLDARFAHSSGGWKESDHDYPCRRQNPHMHLFEAFMSLYEATEDEIWLARAAEIFSLFETHFFDTASGVVLEYFQEDLSPLTGEKGEVVEPGHMMEWVWLLRWYQGLTGKDTSSYADILYDNAIRIGVSDGGLLYNEIAPDGRVLNAGKRCWPMTEFIKAGLAQASAGRNDCEHQAAQAIERLLNHFTSVPTRGAYVDRLDEHDHVTDATSPASTMYHFITAAIEISRYLAVSGGSVEP